MNRPHNLIPNLGLRPWKSSKINLKGHEVINVTKKEEKTKYLINVVHILWFIIEESSIMFAGGLFTEIDN